MSEKESESTNQVHTLFRQLKEYINIKSDLIELQAKRMIILMISSIGSSLSIILILFFMMVFMSFAAAYYLNTLFDNSYMGFVIVSGFYFLLGLILILFNTRIKHAVSNAIIKQLFNEEDEDEKDQ